MGRYDEYNQIEEGPNGTVEIVKYNQYDEKNGAVTGFDTKEEALEFYHEHDALDAPLKNGCEHDSACIEHKDMRGSKVELWIACPDCNGYWTLTGDLDRLDSHTSRDR